MSKERLLYRKIGVETTYVQTLPRNLQPEILTKYDPNHKFVNLIAPKALTKLQLLFNKQASILCGVHLHGEHNYTITVL